MSKNIQNILRLFMDSLKEYQLETGDNPLEDERSSSEFAKLWLDSSDGEALTKDVSKLEAENAELQKKFNQKHNNYLDATEREHLLTKKINELTARYE